MTRAAEFYAMDAEELSHRLSEMRRELLNLRFQLATGQLDNVSQVRQVRRDVARALTVLRQMEIAEAEGVELRAPEPTAAQLRARQRDDQARAHAEAEPAEPPEAEGPEAAAIEGPEPAASVADDQDATQSTGEGTGEGATGPANRRARRLLRSRRGEPEAPPAPRSRRRAGQEPDEEQ